MIQNKPKASLFFRLMVKVSYSIVLLFFCYACSEDKLVKDNYDEGLRAGGENFLDDRDVDHGHVDMMNALSIDQMVVQDMMLPVDMNEDQEMLDLPWITLPEGTQVLEATPQRDGDPEEGYHHFVNSPFVSCGIPLSVFERVGDVNRFFPLVGLPSEEAYIEGRVGPNEELPYFLTYNRTNNDVEIAATNCMSCHASVFQDQLVVGLGNTTLNTTNDVSIFANGLGTLINDPNERDAWAYWAERMTAVAPLIRLDTKGVVAADNMAFALFGRRDPQTLEWQEEYQINLPDDLPTVPLAVPPLWRMDKKNAMFYSGSFRGDHSRFMFAASSLCLNDLEEMREIDSYFNHVRAWIASLEAPAWPYDINQEKVDRGHRIFERTCSACHGTYGEEDSYPNVVIPAEEIGTDPLLLAFEHLFVEELGPWFMLSPFTESNYLIATGGYVAPPLNGIWITAPYLHNDSVPTLATLLDSSKRPTYWKRTSLDSNDYNTDEIGWHYQVETQGREAGASADVYDTSRLGYLNDGHTYGDHLSEEQRQDLIEYLKTL